ncbi:acyltransferase family protein [Streptomyces sp. NRRL S-1824]|uniref:acyltransferase family protein n=1 Tax=Streptomyces sp. NRRL S-1824 TaxID=1463889 RepID=UPI00099DAF71|nr:acyltransferase [Streptomyces sp. NRRL S-1824]
MGGAHRRGGPQVAVRTEEVAAESVVPAAQKGGRDRYFDALRAFALVRVITHHTFEWPWLGLVFPSMGVMFALAGSLMARSLERPALRVIRGRLRRLLVPLWVFALVIGTAMLLHGWLPGPDVLYWVLPVGDPPGNAWGEQAWAVLWYLRTYLWFVLLSPVLLRAFRLAPLPVLALSLVPVVVLETVGSVPDGRLGSALSDLSVFLFCWLLGFAHRDGVLDRMRPALVVTVAPALLAAGAWWAFHHRVDGAYDLDDIPLAQALWSAGFVLLLLRFRPDFGGLARHRVADRIVKVFNARAVTIYLWHEVALMTSVPLIDLMWNVPAFERDLPLDSMWFQFTIAWVLIAAAVALFGWVEDIAAKRGPRLLP